LENLYPAGEYIAATKHVEDAAILVAANGNGSTIRDGHGKADIRWAEGSEEFPAGESYDRVHEVVMQRCETAYKAAEARRAQNIGRSGAEILGRSQIIPAFKMEWKDASDIQRRLLASCYRRGNSYANEYADGKMIGFDARDEAEAEKGSYTSAPFARLWILMNYNDQKSWREI